MSISRRNTSYLHMKSVSEADESTLRPILRAPYVQLAVIKLWNAQVLEQGNLEPYLVVSLGESRFETKILSEDDEHAHVFELDIVQGQPLMLLLMDKDDYGKHSLISSLLIPENCFSDWVGHPHDVYIRIEPSDLSESEDAQPHVYTLTEDMILTDGERRVQPHLHVRFLVVDEESLNRLQVEFKEHRIRSTATETYTQYAVEVSRGDGMRWSAKIRYSQISSLRRALSQAFPEVRSVSFPGKTYLDCFSSLCNEMGRFHESRIESRKKGLEAFLNAILQNQKYHIDSLLDLLQAHFTSSR